MDRKSLKRDLTLMLISLSSWTEGKGSLARTVAWKGYDFDVLDDLEADDYVSFGRKAKSLTLTEGGRRHAEELLGAYGIQLSADPPERRFFRLSLTFNFYTLRCSRTLLVPEHTSFEDFHTQIQACLNWMNYHLYDFRLARGGEELCIAWPDYETGGDPRDGYLMSGEVLPRWLNAANTYLDDFLPRTREMTYSYDYGDGWEVRISLVNQGERYASDVPICCDGDGDAPPEDVGGEGGFEHFLEVLKDPGCEDYEWLKEWGDGQGFERFSRRAANRRLEHWQDWTRADVDKMPYEAQRAAFGKVLVQPAECHGGGATSFTLIEGGGGRAASVAPGDDGCSPDEATCLRWFETYLEGQGLREKTVENHLFNVGFYLNTYLTRMGASVREGIALVGGFLGDFFIHECMWSTRTSIKANATSIKKFYRCMAWRGVVSQEQYRELCAQIKKELPEWIAELEAWDAGDYYDDDWDDG